MKTNCRSSILLHKGEDYLLITVNRAELLATVKRATTIAPPDSPLDVLKGVLLESDSARKMLTVTSTNLEVALVEKIPCSAQEDGALVYSARTLAEMLQRLPEDTVEISRKENRGRMTLTSGSVSYEVDVWDRGAFPKPDLPFPEDTVKVSGIPAVAQHTVFATAQDKDLLSCVKGDGTEFPVLMAAFYGLRRSEIMGLKWDSIDFDANTITIAHVVVEVSIDGKDTIVAKDRPKNKKSYRTLPLVPEYRRLLLQMKKHQEEYRELCGNCYHESDYIYVNDLGEPIRPNYVSQHFKLVLKNNNLREITFHELRHTCASLLLKSGISMKDIQAWLGHSNYNTTANIYAHLESSSKEITGNAMQDNFTISANLAAREAVQE